MRHTQQRSDNDDGTNERRPLLPSQTASTWSIAISTLGLDRDSPSSFEETEAFTQAGKLEEEKETRWFSELKRRSWRNRPSSLWVAPWLMVFGLTVGVCLVPLERLKVTVICKDMLSYPDNNLFRGNLNNLTVIGGGGDLCQTETVLAIIHLLEGRIYTQ
jgi:hypothetical protein